MANLKVTALRGAAWMAMSVFGYRVINLASIIILARLLEPSDFGMFQLAAAVLLILGPLASLGMGHAVIHSKAERGTAAFHGFVLTAIAGVVVCLLLLAVSNPLAVALGNAEVAPLLRWLAVGLFLEGLYLVPGALLEKALMFGRVSGLSMASDLLYTVLALGLAWGGFGVWSLMWAHLARALVKTVLAWTLCPGWEWLVPRPRDANLAKGLVAYGLTSVSSGTLAVFNSQWDNLLVGRVLGTTSLGYYGKSYDFVNLLKIVNDAVSRVLFPTYTKVRDDLPRLARAYVTTLRLVALLIVPSALGIFAIAPEMVPTVLGQKWLPMVGALQILAFMSLVRPLSGTTSPLFMSVGRPGLNVQVSLLHTAIMVPLGVLFLYLGWDIEGVAAAIVIAYAWGFVYNMRRVLEILPLTARDLVKAMAPTLAVGVVMTAAVFAAKAPLAALIGPDRPVLLLLSLMLVGALVYPAVLLLTMRSLVFETLRLVKETVGMRKGAPAEPPPKPESESDEAAD